MKVGDKVRYLNAVGGGVVTKVIDKDCAMVLDEDGFESPAFIRELVVVEAVNKYNFPIEQHEKNNVDSQSKYEIKTLDKTVSSIVEENPRKDELSVFLAFVPKQIKQLQTTDYDCFLINDCNYSLQFNLFFGEQGNLSLRETGLIEPNTKLFVEKFKKEDLHMAENIVFQAIAFKQSKEFKLKPLIDFHKEIDTLQLCKLHNFVENPFFFQPAFLLDFVKHTAKQHPAVDFIEKQKNDTTEKTKPKLQNKRRDSIEVDLHINALLDSVVGLSNADILNCQLDKFHAVMSEYRNCKGQKIVFIHGKGNGVLRSALEKQLKTRYTTCYFQDASFREYGFGATQVTIR